MIRQLFRRSMSCQDVLEVLQSYLDGETDEATARKVVAHLDRCDQCDHETWVYRRIKISLGSREVPIDPQVRAALTRYGQRVANGEIAEDAT